jgi:hypothetical protein
MTHDFWQSLQLDVHIYSYKSVAWGQNNGRISTHVLCECVPMCVQAGAHREVGRHVYFLRDKEVISDEVWNMLHNVFICWPSSYQDEHLYNVVINNIKNFCILFAKCIYVLYMFLTASAP